MNGIFFAQVIYGKKGQDLGPKCSGADFTHATFVNWCITTVPAVIVLGFMGLALKDIPITALSNANPEIIQVAILSVYISCWAYGTSIDTKIQGGIYADDPQGGRVRTGSIAAVAFLAVVSVILRPE
ncbi:hypothetical protein ACIPUD_24050 [Bradyrhizobium sp. CAR08]